jgi:hypothetical protein
MPTISSRTWTGLWADGEDESGPDGQNGAMSADRADAGNPLVRLSREQIRDLGTKGWLTHDGMWYDQTARALGVARANELNRAAIRAMAPFEVGRLCEALGVQPSEVRDAVAAARFVAEGIQLVTPASVGGHLHVRAGEGVLQWEWEPGECFAYKGMQRFGYLDGYECGVIYRVECWLEALGVRPRGEVAVGVCLMHRTGRCAGEVPLSFPG